MAFLSEVFPTDNVLLISDTEPEKKDWKALEQGIFVQLWFIIFSSCLLIFRGQAKALNLVTEN